MKASNFTIQAVKLFIISIKKLTKMLKYIANFGIKKLKGINADLNPESVKKPFQLKYMTIARLFIGISLLIVILSDHIYTKFENFPCQSILYCMNALVALIMYVLKDKRVVWSLKSIIPGKRKTAACRMRSKAP